MSEKSKDRFIDELKKAGGIISAACENAGISRQTYYNWKDADPGFAAMVDDVMQAQIDFVESRLMKNISAGDTTSIIFYLKTRGKNRGWTEKPSQQQGVAQPTAASALPDAGHDELAEKEVRRKVKQKKDYIVRLLKEQGKYTAELSMQVKITAQLLVRTEILAEDILTDSSGGISVELSREGNERKAISPKEKLYLDFVQQSQRALRALGMNTDSKERKTDNDTFGDFLNTFSDNSSDSQ